jgi:uncharacterized membrane protein YfcA
LVSAEYSTAFWICAVSAVTLVGIAKAGFGSGVGVVATPILALTIPVTDAAALLLPLLICCDLFSVIHYRTNFDRRSINLLLPGALIGITVGALTFGYFQGNERILKIGIGALALAFVLYQVLRKAIEGAVKRHTPSVFEGVLMGAVSGFTSTLAHAGGPPIAVFLLPQKLPRGLFVGTTVIFFAVINAVKLVPYQYLGLLKMGNLFSILLLSPLTVVGVKLGIYLNARFNDLWFNRVVYTVLFVTGWKLILG